jgi:hypothetical protein
MSFEFARRECDPKVFTKNNIRALSKPSSSMGNISWSRVPLIKFTIQHAKTIRSGYGIPICFTTEDATGDALAFLQLVYLWSHMSTRHPDNPFLSHRSRDGRLSCLVYTQVHKAITICAGGFGFNPEWLKPHCVRMAAPAGGSDGQVLNLGRWKSVPTSLAYQGSSTSLQLIAPHSKNTEDFLAV